MTIVERLGWVLLHFVWQGAVIALALAVLLALTRETQARLRYALSCAALVLMLGAALTTATRVRTMSGSAPDDTARMASGESQLTPAASGGRRVRAGSLPRLMPATEKGEDATRSGIVQPIVNRAMPWLVVAWLAGVLLLSFRLLGGWWSTRSLRASGVSPVPEWCLAQLSALSARMRIARPVAIVSSIRVTVPVILGHVKPVILLPAAALSGLSAAQVEAIVAHELAHVRRHDYLLNLVQTVIETLLFYHPAVWWVSRQVRETREHCCDDLAVTACGSRREYVNALLELEELRGSMPVLALGATDGSLLARGRRLLAPAPVRPASPRLPASVIALIVVAAAVVSAFNAASVPTWSGPAAAPAAPTMPVSQQTAQAPEGTPVIPAPDTAASLSSRWTWAEGAARTSGRRRYWIGYGVPPVKTLPPFLYSDRSSTVMGDRISFQGDLFSTGVTDLRFPGRTLAIPPGAGQVKLLFELDASGREPRLASAHASTMSLPVDTRNLPVFWLGTADAAQSLDRIDRFYQATSSPDLKHDLIVAAGVHDASAAVVAWLERRIASGDPEEVRGNAAEWIAWHPIAASIAVLDRTARTDRSSHVRQEAAEALGDLALPEAAPVLIALARSLSDVDARREAVEALGSRPERAASDALAAIARDDANLDIQREAVETLGDFEDKRGVDVLIELARSHRNVDVRKEAIETLGDALPEDKAVKVLEEFLADRDPQVQEEAVDTIAGIEDTSSVETLMQLARSHQSADVRREAVEALADRAHGQDESKPSAELTKIVELVSTLATADRDVDVQMEAIQALGEIGGVSAVAALEKLATTHAEEDVRIEAIEALGESAASAGETAKFLKGLALAEKSEQVRSEALETLADLHDGAGIAALIELAREHPSADTRREALEQLLESDHPAARAFFERALKK
jgi:HEAT repeat protein/beta-lactamase regulating signal transducer with metallopeptidase domain